MKINSVKFGLILFISISLTSFKSSEEDLVISIVNKDNYEVTQLMMKRQYVDRWYKIGKFPSFLQGSKLIKTANDDKSSKGENYLTFNVNKDVSVFVAHWSSIKVTPKWLRDSFQRTDLIINSGEDDYILYKKDFSAGKVSLGGNIESEEEDHAMYSVIISEKLEIPEKVKYLINDYLSLLVDYKTYNSSFSEKFPLFEYRNQNNSDLEKLRYHFISDSVVNSKDELAQIIGLMKWVNKRIKHIGSNNLSDSRSLKILESYDSNGKGVNCKAMSIVLNDIYLAMGYRARIISCMPHEEYDTESHVTNLVYSKSLKKWVYMDPTFSAYVTDESGLILDHSEIRSALINGDSLTVKGGLSHNGEPYGGGQNYYLNKYMAKNLFRFSSPLISEYGYEYSNPEMVFINLNPTGYRDKRIEYNKMIKNRRIGYNYFTQDDSKFWNNPEY